MSLRRARSSRVDQGEVRHCVGRGCKRVGRLKDGEVLFVCVACIRKLRDAVQGHVNAR